MAFIDQGEFKAMKTLSGRRAPCCDKHQFCAKMTVSTSTVCEISLLNIEVLTRKKEREKEKWHFHYCTLLRLAVFLCGFLATDMSFADPQRHSKRKPGRLNKH